jgi:hypothetical protein
MYGFTRRIDDVKAHSAYPIHWLVAEGRSKIWHGMGETFPEAWKFQMFPGLLPLLFPLAELFRSSPQTVASSLNNLGERTRWLRRLDVMIVVALVLSILAIGFEGTDHFGSLSRDYFKSEHALGFLLLACTVRLCLAYPLFLRRGENINLIETLHSKRRDDAFWVGSVLVVIGFLY